MKQTAIAALICIVLMGCRQGTGENRGGTADYTLYTEKVDNCEYIVATSGIGKAVSIIHKQNCSNHKQAVADTSGKPLWCEEK